VIEPGVLELVGTRYQVRHSTTASWREYAVFWDGQCVRPCHMNVAAAKQSAMKHMADLLEVGRDP
jgi:hypothetical protein